MKQFYMYSILPGNSFESKDDAVAAAKRELAKYNGSYDSAYILQATDVVVTPVPSYEVQALS